jgi:hypothetical protein
MASKNSLARLEDLLKITGYVVRYAKGNFRSGACLLHAQQVVLVNAFLSTEGRVVALEGVVRELDLDTAQLSAQQRKAYLELRSEHLKASVRISAN